MFTIEVYREIDDYGVNDSWAWDLICKGVAGSVLLASGSSRSPQEVAAEAAAALVNALSDY